MQFGYFTLSDNSYRDNTRPANRFIADIIDEAIEADRLGMHSAWIGEHHFSTLGVLSCPDLALAFIAARTQRIRLAPAVTVLPLHHPIRVAEQWATLDLMSGGRVDFAAGRGYDRREYEPLGVDFDDNQSIFEEGMEVVRRLWDADGPISRIMGGIIGSITFRLRRRRYSGRYPLTSLRFRNHRSNSRAVWAAD